MIKFLMAFIFILTLATSCTKKEKNHWLVILEEKRKTIAELKQEYWQKKKELDTIQDEGKKAASPINRDIKNLYEKISRLEDYVSKIRLHVAEKEIIGKDFESNFGENLEDFLEGSNAKLNKSKKVMIPKKIIQENLSDKKETPTPEE